MIVAEGVILAALICLWQGMLTSLWPTTLWFSSGAAAVGLVGIVRSWGQPVNPWAPRRQLVAAVVAAALGAGLLRSNGAELAVRSGLALAVLFLALSFVWRRLRHRSGVGEDQWWAEDLRIAVVVATGVWVIHPFLTPRFLGGVDARWYLSNFSDAIEQVRAGVFPVYVGQGESMFNGSIHPFRTAPYHHYLGILIDTLTFRSLTAVALQHLTLLVTVLQGSLLCYVGFASLAPGRRWRAGVLALVYATAPLMLAYIVSQEMYMTFMTFGYLPLLFTANIQLMRKDSATAWAWTAATVAVIWYCHPVVGMLSAMFTAGTQAFRLLAWDCHGRSWLRAVLAALLAGVLLSYTFYSMRELGSVKLGEPVQMMIEFAAWAVAGVCFIRLLASRNLFWLLGVFAAAAIVGRTEPTCRTWFALAGGLGGVVCLLGRWRPWFGDKERLAVWAAMLALGAGLLAMVITPELNGRRIAVYDEAMRLLGLIHPRFLHPISPLAIELGDIQVGYTLWALLLSGAVVTLWTRSREIQVVSLTGLLVGALVVPAPKVTSFLITVMPDQIYYTVGINLWLRVIPLVALCALFAGGTVVMALDLRGWRRTVPALLLLTAALTWNARELEKFIGRAHAATNSLTHTQDVQRTENTQLYSYAYDLLPKPGYFTTGVIDYHLESRLLRPRDLSVIPDPIFSRPPAQTVTLDTSIDPKSGPLWLYMTPKLKVAPGERQAWVFEFGNKPYQGNILLRNLTGFYRTYQMPAAAVSAKGFGYEPGHSKMLAVWNSTTREEEVEMVFLRNEVPAGDPEFGPFARMSVFPYRPDELRIKTVHLIPDYEVAVSTDEAVMLETPRVFTPGYSARVDGHAAAISRSPDGLVMIPLAPGTHRVRLAFQGSVGLRMALGVSVLAWCGILWTLVWPRIRPGAAVRGAV